MGRRVAGRGVRRADRARGAPAATHPIRRVEGLLDTVAMMNVDINVQHPTMVLQQLEDGEDDIVGVAEAGRLALFGVVQPARPVDAHVALPLVELDRATYRAAGARLAKVVEAIEDRRVFANIEALHLLRVLLQTPHIARAPYKTTQHEVESAPYESDHHSRAHALTHARAAAARGP